MIVEILKKHNARGKERAISVKKLAALTGLSERAVKATVQRERQNHFIMSSTAHGGGYYRPENRNDILMFMKKWNRRIAKASGSLALARKLLKRQKTNPEQKLW